VVVHKQATINKSEVPVQEFQKKCYFVGSRKVRVGIREGGLDLYCCEIALHCFFQSTHVFICVAYAIPQRMNTNSNCPSQKKLYLSWNTRQQRGDQWKLLRGSAPKPAPASPAL
jgi:hypothetical protein